MKIANAPSMRVRYLPQDPLTTPPLEISLAPTPDLSNDRFKMNDRQATARPDDQGNFLYQPGTPEFQQVNSFVAAQRTLQVFEKAVGHKIPWAFEGPLKIQPHYGEGFNAFYLRQDHSLNFFDGYDPKLNKTIAGSESLDVVSHEAGHAILDGLKPGLMGWFGSAEAPAFHESFGDMAAILTALQEPSLLERVCQETGGDLRQPNVISRLAEEMSRGINDTYLNGSRPEDWVMRDAVNDYLYQRPEGLPEHAPPEELAREPHSFSRIFTGAFWDILCGLNQQFRNRGQDPLEALQSARDTMATLLGRAVELGPNRLNRLSQMAQALLQADQHYLNGQFRHPIESSLAARNLLPQKPSASAPCITLERAPGSLEEANLWLRTSDPTSPFRAQALWKNDRGETFVRYDAVQEVEIDKSTTTDLASSLTLGIDSQGKVFHQLYEPLDDESLGMARADIQATRKRTCHAQSDIERGYRSILQADGRVKLIKIPMSPGTGENY